MLTVFISQNDKVLEMKKIVFDVEFEKAKTMVEGLEENWEGSKPMLKKNGLYILWNTYYNQLSDNSGIPF